MLLIAHKLRELPFSELMEVYRESNLENGSEFYPEEPIDRQLQLAEQGFYDYLSQIFFQTEGAAYLIWQQKECYVSALRLEPYQDGLLMEALETALGYRGRGYAKTLILAMLECYSGVKIYSHVSKRNIPSLRTHESCGFEKILDYARYADGSVLHNSVTYCHKALK